MAHVKTVKKSSIFLNIGILMILLLNTCESDSNADSEEKVDENYEIVPSTIDTLLDESNIDPNSVYTLKTRSLLYIVRTNQVGNGSDLYAVNITDNTHYAGKLKNGDDHIRDISAGDWNELKILATATSSYVEVHQIMLENQTISSDILQKIAFDGTVRQLIVFNTNREGAEGAVDLCMIVVEKFSKLHGALRLFRWIDSAFHLADEKNTQEIHNIAVLAGLENGLQPVLFALKFPGNKNVQKTSIQIFQIDVHVKIKQRQQFLVDIERFDAYTVNGENYFLACKKATGSQCIVYKMIGDEFIEQHQFGNSVEEEEEEENNSNAWNKLAYTTGLIVAGFKSKIRGYFDPNMQDFFPVHLNRTNLVGFDLYTAESNRIFLILTYEHQRKVIIQKTELKVLPIQRDKVKTDAVEDCLDRIRKLLYSRKLILDKVTIPEIEHVDRIREKQVGIISGRIDRLHLKNIRLSTPSNLRKRLNALRDRINDWISATKSMKVVHVDNLIIKNLHYNKSLINGISKTDENFLIFNRNTTAQNLTAKYLDQVQSRGANEHDSLESQLKLNLKGNIGIRELNVKKIGNIDWPLLHSTAFLRGRDSLIRGSVQFEKPIQCQELTVLGAMNGKRVADFFTTNTDQDVRSNIFVSKFLAENMTARTLNGLDVQDFALLGDDNVIKGPVRISKFKVSGNLTLVEGKQSRETQHIIGTRTGDFLQIYTGKVIINGSLTLTNLTTLNDDTALFVKRSDGQQVQLTNFENVFWMRNEIQVFDTVSFRNSRSTLYELVPSFLNDHLLSDYLLCSKNTASVQSSLNFKSAAILGNLNTDLAFGSHRVEMLSANLVRLNERTEIFGSKNFQNILKVENLNTKTINTIPTQNLVRKDQENLEFTGMKIMKKMAVTRKFDVAERLDVVFYNEYNLKSFFDSVVRTDRGPIQMQSVKFLQNVEIGNLTVFNFNNIELRSISDYFDYQNDSFKLRKSVNIQGGVRFNRNLVVKRFNEIDWDQYWNLVVKKNTGVWDIGGRKLFRNDIIVEKSFKTKNINGLSVARFFKNTLKRDGFQIIQAPWRFLNVQVESLIVSANVNNINVKNLINTDEDVKIFGSIGVASVKIEENISGQIDWNLDALLNRLKFLDRPYWTEIHVQNNIKYPKKFGHYEYIEQNAVQYMGTQEILGRVRFRTVPKFLSIQSKYDFNGKNLTEIVHDALVRSPSSKVQIVTASKYFRNILRFFEFEIKGDLNVEKLNNIDILNLNSSLYRRGYEIPVPKYFKIPPIIGELNVYGSINTVDFTNLVFVLPNIQIPSFYAQQIFVKTGLSIQNLNKVNLDSFLYGRVRLRGHEQEIFGYLTLKALRTKRVNFSSINGIDIENMILTECEFDQEIHGRKEIRGVLKLIGPAGISKINSVDIIQKYSETLFLNQDLNLKNVKITGNVRFDSSIKNIESVNEQNLQSYQKRAKDLTNVLEKLKTNPLKPKISPKFGYLEFDSNYEVVWNQNSDDFQQFQSVKTDGRSYCNSSFLDIFRTNIANRIAINQRFHTSIRSSRIENLNLTNENTCSTGHSKFNVNFNKAVHDFQFSHIIENFELFNKIEAKNDSESFVLIEFSSSNRNSSIVLIKFDATKSHIYPLQEIPTPSNRKFEMKLFRGNFNSFLVLPETDGLNLFEFDRSRNLFLKKYSYRGCFDRVAILEIDQTRTHAVFACYGENSVEVYAESDLIQKIEIPGSVENLVGVSNQGGDFLIVVSCESYFYLYKFEYFEGWMLKTFGYYRNLKYFIPYMDSFLVISRVENQMEAAVLKFHLRGLE